MNGERHRQSEDSRMDHYTDRRLLFDVDEGWIVKMHPLLFGAFVALAGCGAGAVLAVIT